MGVNSLCAASFLVGLLTVLPTTVLPDESTVNRLSFSLAAEYSEGNYGGDQTHQLWFVPLKLELETDLWRASISSAYLDANTEPATDGQLLGRQASGDGDVILALTYQHPFKLPGQIYIDFANRLTIPTEDHPSAISYGLYQWNSRLDWFRPAQRFALFGSVGYRWFERHATSTVQDGATLSIGINKALSDRWSTAISVETRQSSHAGSPDAVEWIPSLSWQPARGPGVSIYAVIGTNHSSPEYALGLQFQFKR